MPIKNATPPSSAIKHYKSLSYETLTASWLLNDGWDVFMPMIDHGQKTDIVISDGSIFYRIQIKSVETNDEHSEVDNKWGNVKIDFVIYFSRQGNWGYITRPFTQKKCKLNAPGNIRFHQHPKHFIKVFELI